MLGSPAFPAPPTGHQETRYGTWQPLPYIHAGFVIHSFNPSLPPQPPGKVGETSKAAAYRNSIYSTSTGLGFADRTRGTSTYGYSNSIYGQFAGDGGTNPYEVGLDIGDEFFAFEEYRCTIEEDGRGDLWYRGYVVQSVSLPNLVPNIPSGNRAIPPKPEPSVLIGIFPASCVHVRPEASVDDGTLTEAYEAAIRKAQERDLKGKSPSRTVPGSFGGDMEAVREEDEEGSPRQPMNERTPTHIANQTPKANGIQVNGDQGDILGSGRSPARVIDVSAGETPGNAPFSPDKDLSADAPVTSTIRKARPKSGIIAASRVSMVEAEQEKESPPLPRLTAGDSTLAGQQTPLVDEMACAIRDWYQRLPTYLINRDYRLFTTVVQHIDALWLGRRQLLSQTLSGDELARVKKECVSRLVKCNVAQGLEVIVRSLEDGSVIVTDKERAYSGATWLGGMTTYLHQLQFAYIDLTPLDTLTSTSIKPHNSLSAAQNGRFSLTSDKKGRESLLATPQSFTPSYDNLLLDVRAFIASPCVPGETVELFFSIYSARDNKFITEEYCLILNHLGSPARDAEQRLGRLRTLFTELKSEDLSASLYLVCRMVRNGALKMRSDALAGTLDSSHRQNGTLSAGRQSSIALSHAGDRGTLRTAPSTIDGDTDDSFSITSGFAGHRTMTVETGVTTNAPSIIDGRPTFRRPLGCAVLQLPPLSKLTAEQNDNTGIMPGTGLEYSMPIYVARDEATFATLHEDIIQQKAKDFATSSRLEALVISLKMLHGDAQQLVREHPSLLLDIPLCSRLGFPDVVAPGTSRNDIYIKLWSGTFFSVPSSSGGSIRVRKSASSTPTNQGNVQVTLEVRKMDGTVMPDVMFCGGTGEPAQAHYHSLVFPHNDKPVFGELVKISLPPTASLECHVFLTFRSRSRGKDRTTTAIPVGTDPHEMEKPFAFAYLPLTSNMTCVKDASHDLILYRMEKNLQPAPNMYFQVPSADTGSSQPPGSSVKNVITLRDRMSLRTYLCSSVQSQDVTLQSLFRWQSLLSDVDGLCRALEMLGFVNEEEISKFMPTVLDALFGIVTSHVGDRQTQVDALVFKGLIKVLSMTSDRRFPNFKQVLDTYVDTQFNYPSSSSSLLRYTKSIMSRPKDTEYRSFLKVWHLFFRFIIRSRELDRSKGIGLDATSAHIEADFRQQTKDILNAMNNLMQSTDKGLIGTQTLAVQHYADVLPYLAEVFPPLEIAEMIITFADTLTYAKGSIAIYKLVLILQVVKHVFDSSEARALLIPALVRWVKPHLGRYEQPAAYVRNGTIDTGASGKLVKWLECNRLAITVVAYTVDKLQEWLSSPLILEDEGLRTQEEDNIEYCLTLLPSLLHSHAELLRPETLTALQQYQSSSSGFKRVPEVFPTSHPFSLVSELPPTSLLDRTHMAAGDDLLPSSGPFQPALAECSVVIFSLLTTSPAVNISRYLTEIIDIDGQMETGKMLNSTFTFFRSILRFSSFPKQWLTLSLMCFQSIITALDPISDLMQTSFIPPIDQMESFDQGLWTDCLDLLCDICASDELALEEHSPQRRRAEWIIAGDLRDEGARLLKKLWNALGWSSGESKREDADQTRLGGYQTRFTSLAGRILELCLSSHDQLCETAVEILFSMIYAEYVLDGRLVTIASEIFSKLEMLFLDKSNNSIMASDPTMRAYFVAHLRAVFETTQDIDPAFQNKVNSLLNEVELFIELLLDLRDVPDDQEWKDEKSLAIHRLILFTQKIDRKQLCVRFIHQLVKLNVDSEDWASAGLAFKLHADMYDWKLDGDLLDVFSDEEAINLPAQSQFARRESLYYHAIDYFAEGEAYELALELCQELVTQHQRQTYNIAKLSDLLTYQARLWEKMGTTTRRHPEYFRLAYFGDFSSMNKGKDYIVRGKPWQRFSDFCELMQHKHPAASIHRSKIPPAEGIRQGEDPVMWITSVIPEPDTDHPALKDDTPESIQAHYKNNEVKRFSSIRPYVRKQAATESVLTWTEKTWLSTAKPLPDLLNRAEVTDIKYEQISPLQTALLEVNKATRVLRGLLNPKAGHQVDVKLLGTMLNGAVDSPVNGGVKLYRSTFLNDEYPRRHPADIGQINQLRSALLDYVRAIQEGLTVHKSLSRDLAFHEALKSHFFDAFPEEIAELPPLPATPQLGSRGQNHNMANGHAIIPTINLPRSNTDPARLSTISMGTEIGYILPELRVGPTYRQNTNNTSPVLGSPLVHSPTSPLRISVDNNTLSPTADHMPQSILTNSTASSPRNSVSTISASKRNSLNTQLQFANGNGGSVGGSALSHKARSIVGSLGKGSRSSVSVQSERSMGEITEREEEGEGDGVVIDVTNGPGSPEITTGSKGRKLGRFGSFMRKKE